MTIFLNLSIVENELGGNKIDQTWMDALRTSKEYDNEVKEFIEFAKMNAPNKNKKYFCPCIKCLNES